MAGEYVVYIITNECQFSREKKEKGEKKKKIPRPVSGCISKHLVVVLDIGTGLGVVLMRHRLVEVAESLGAFI